MAEFVYPKSETWWVRALRFSNMLDETNNKLAPTKIQAWGATINAIYQAVSADMSTVAGATQTVLSTAYAVAAHVLHQRDKKEQNAQAVRLK